VVLQHGSILLDGSQEDMPRLGYEMHGARATSLTGAPAALPAAGAVPGYHDAVWRPRGHGATTLGELLGAVPDPAAVGAAVVRGFEVELGIALARSTLSPEEVEGAARLQRLYAAGHWTWRC
jgi:hypothetical protein